MSMVTIHAVQTMYDPTDQTLTDGTVMPVRANVVGTAYNPVLTLDSSAGSAAAAAGVGADAAPGFGLAAEAPSGSGAAANATTTPLENITGADAGIPGDWTPVNYDTGQIPADLAALQGSGIVASPLTLWTVGQYIALGDASHAYWTNAAWAAGEAPA